MKFKHASAKRYMYREKCKLTLWQQHSLPSSIRVMPYLDGTEQRVQSSDELFYKLIMSFKHRKFILNKKARRNCQKIQENEKNSCNRKASLECYMYLMPPLICTYTLKENQGQEIPQDPAAETIFLAAGHDSSSFFSGWKQYRSAIQWP